MFYKGKDEGIPDDVHEIFFSGNFWYAASEERLPNGKPKACGVGNTEEEAIADMRDLVSRYVPVAERQSPWDATQKYGSKPGEKYRNPILIMNQRVKLNDGREAVVMDAATHRKSRTLEIAGVLELQVVKNKEIGAFWDMTVGWVDCVWE
jgi:hypothetical protein